MTNPEVFGFQVTQEGAALTKVSLKGELRRGLGQSAALLSFQAELPSLEKRAVSGLIIFDLTELTYWDTMGITLLIPVVNRINTRIKKRAGLIGPTDTVVYEAAKDKFGAVGTDDIPWEKTEDDLIRKLTG